MKYVLVVIGKKCDMKTIDDRSVCEVHSVFSSEKERWCVCWIQLKRDFTVWYIQNHGKRESTRDDGDEVGGSAGRAKQSGIG